MSRSIRRHPIIGMTGAASEKQDKRAAHQARRARFRTLAANTDIEALQDVSLRQVSNVYAFAKDGKQYLHEVAAAVRSSRRPRPLSRRLHQLLGK